MQAKSHRFNISFPHYHYKMLPGQPHPSLCCPGSMASFNGSKDVPFPLGNKAASALPAQA